MVRIVLGHNHLIVCNASDLAFLFTITAPTTARTLHGPIVCKKCRSKIYKSIEQCMLENPSCARPRVANEKKKDQQGRRRLKWICLERTKEIIQRNLDVCFATYCARMRRFIARILRRSSTIESESRRVGLFFWHACVCAVVASSAKEVPFRSLGSNENRRRFCSRSVHQMHRKCDRPKPQTCLLMDYGQK
jgi:hypothetical protein